MIDHGWERKCWGKTRLIFANEHHSLHELQVVAGWQCSKHRHRERANSFFVDVGRLLVLQFHAGDYLNPRASHVAELGPGDTFEVPSGIWHRFAVLASGRVFETYWPDSGGIVRLDDIERADEGGRYQPSATLPLVG